MTKSHPCTLSATELIHDLYEVGTRIDCGKDWDETHSCSIDTCERARYEALVASVEQRILVPQHRGSDLVTSGSFRMVVNAALLT